AAEQGVDDQERPAVADPGRGPVERRRRRVGWIRRRGRSRPIAGGGSGRHGLHLDSPVGCADDACDLHTTTHCSEASMSIFEELPAAAADVAARVAPAVVRIGREGGAGASAGGPAWSSGPIWWPPTPTTSGAPR